ncbi:MAG: carbohydrate kinase family protein, partial [Planctomycetes bacterium]|nr:carbohydrate kinase family protein [Planctomycetota bacterium]
DLTEIFKPGKLTNVDNAILSVGGPVSNTGMAMAKIGLDVRLNGKVGDDSFGNIIKELLGKEAAKSFKTAAGQNTSYSVIMALPGIDRFILHNPATNDTFGSEDINYNDTKDCCLFHFGYPNLMKRIYENNGSELTEIYKRVKSLTLTTSLDMSFIDPASEAGNADWLKIMRNTLPFVDIFMPSIEEITFMLDRKLFDKRRTQASNDDPVLFYQPQDYSNISETLLEMGVKIVALKSGINGYYLRSASADKIAQLGKARPDNIDLWSDRELWCPSFKTDKFASGTGAGDATIAGFLSALINGCSPIEALRIANTVGCQNVQTYDTLSGIKDWKTTLAQASDMTRGQNPLRIETCGWKYDKKNRLFAGANDKSKI